MGIMDKLKKNSKIKETEILADSKFFSEKDQVPTEVPMINVALSGSIDGGLTSGLTVLAGPSKHFKTSFALLMAAADLRFGDGSSYINCGFKRLKNTNPNYFYLVNGMLFSRVKFQKHKLKTLFPDNYSNEKTEEQIMNNVGYHRIYDCGNAVYVYTKKEP
jgi:hypothetical protein